eukprot:TRINITY_DN9447_c0_g4_i1.p1 TRINITY_DN9447_c0_g4~~TRINITY_DN9447_c0_g4_i1.p1  ORF type:complete len:241 (-),score=79.57 TRINITY_DN9447_c0_g4_i1:495-1217(-)
MKKIQKQIDSFMEHMKKITQGNENSREDIQQEVVKEEDKSDSEAIQEKLAIPANIETKIKPQSPLSDEKVEEAVVEENKQTNSVTQAIPEESKADAQASRGSPVRNGREASPKRRATPKTVTDMEERARKRRERREELQKLYEEKQRAKEQQRAEEERKKAEDEKRRVVELREKKRRQELIKKSKEEAKAKLSAKIEQAAAHYNKVLVKYSLKGFIFNIETKKSKIAKADFKYCHLLRKV